MKQIQIVAASILFLSFSQLSFATSTNVVACSTKSGSYDYGNATGQESSACHSTDQWQKLGKNWDKESSDNAMELTPSTNDGVTWRTSTDGINWTDYSNTSQLTSGGYVQFQFEVTRSIVGNHKYDQLESWIDWNQDGDWDDRKYRNQNQNRERIIAEKWWKHKDSDGNVQKSRNLDPSKVIDNYNFRKDGTKNWDLSDSRGETIYNSQDTTAMFTTNEMQIPIFDTLTQVWLRARIVCENSLEHHSDGMNLIATGFQDQGEVEDYRLTIAKKPPAVVPEPSTLFIFAISLFALGAQRKKQKI